jgi:hypothetical protein
MTIWQRITAVFCGARTTTDNAPMDVVSAAPCLHLQYRQGDLLFVGQLWLPKPAVARGDGVIQLGEVTGHAHRVVGGSVYDVKGGVYLAVGRGARVIHEEHAPIELPEGFYRVVRQREYRGEDEWADVRD